jgi:hypothetical protein
LEQPDGEGDVDNINNEEYQRRNNELGLDDYEMEEMGNVFDAEEMEDGEQDYGMMAVDDYD